MFSLKNNVIAKASIIFFGLVFLSLLLYSVMTKVLISLGVIESEESKITKVYNKKIDNLVKINKDLNQTIQNVIKENKNEIKIIKQKIKQEQNITKNEMKQLQKVSKVKSETIVVDKKEPSFKLVNHYRDYLKPYKPFVLKKEDLPKIQFHSEKQIKQTKEELNISKQNIDMIWDTFNLVEGSEK